MVQWCLVLVLLVLVQDEVVVLLRLAGLLRHVREALAAEHHVHERGLAHVRPADEGHLRHLALGQRRHRLIVGPSLVRGLTMGSGAHIVHRCSQISVQIYSPIRHRIVAVKYQHFYLGQFGLVI